MECIHTSTCSIRMVRAVRVHVTTTNITTDAEHTHAQRTQFKIDEWINFLYRKYISFINRCMPHSHTIDPYFLLSLARLPTKWAILLLVWLFRWTLTRESIFIYTILNSIWMWIELEVINAYTKTYCSNQSAFAHMYNVHMAIVSFKNNSVRNVCPCPCHFTSAYYD